MKIQSSEGMELRILGVNLGFENPSMRMEEGRENLEGVLQDMPSNEQVSQGEGLTFMSKEVMQDFNLSKLSTKRLIRLRRSASLTRLNRMVFDYTQFSVKIKS